MTQFNIGLYTLSFAVVGLWKAIVRTRRDNKHDTFYTQTTPITHIRPSKACFVFIISSY